MTIRSFIQAKGIVLLVAALVLLGVAGCSGPPGGVIIGTVPVYVMQPEAIE